MGRVKSCFSKLFATKVLSAFLLFAFLIGCSQSSQENTVDYFDIIRPKFTGELAYKTTEFVEQYWRVAGNTGFNKSVYWIADHLEKAGYVLENAAKEDDRLTYRIEKRPMKNPTWEPVSASLQIIGKEEPLLVSERNRNMTYLNSASTPEDGVKAEVVYVENPEDVPDLDLNGKIVFTEKGAGPFYDSLVSKGALGIITYNNPSYLQPEKNSASIQFRSLPPQTDTKLWGIALSFAAKEKLKAALKKGKTQVQVNIQTKIYPSEELTVVANIRGLKNPNERLIFSAHIQEPGANDNATGVGVQLEMATLAAKLLKENSIQADRTLTFLWGDEIISTRRYIDEDQERAKGIKYGISLDMVGENTAVTGGSFLIEKMPDPSAIWTRGDDKHSEWGGDVMTLDEMKPHFLNDFIINNFKAQGDFANWEVNTNPFEGGSDHTPFLDADIPGLLLWHFTDQFYHTDNDRLDKVSQETLKNVGTAALVSGLQLVNSDVTTARSVLKEIELSANKRLAAEFELSKKAISENKSIAEEKEILKAWEDWYLQTFESVKDMTTSTDGKLNTEIDKAKNSLKDLNEKQLSNLEQ
ncbi:M28 family peptidase [Maribacter aestuarii]|uniref:M28 family peptidase n=1 Tax=Maribacter aestuarii TaxID=1130723 RepID=UPI00248AC3BE|nr:M28 family peptidase [Maribacter aestuarii]